MEDVLRIEAAQRTDAECIAGALAEYGASVEPSGAVVIVTGMGSGTLVTTVLDALKACLDANAIAPVKVSIDDQHYVMEEAAWCLSVARLAWSEEPSNRAVRDGGLLGSIGTGSLPGPKKRTPTLIVWTIARVGILNPEPRDPP